MCYKYFLLCFNWRINLNFCCYNNSIWFCDRKIIFCEYDVLGDVMLLSNGVNEK